MKHPVALLALVCALVGGETRGAAALLSVERASLPPGFTIEVFADEVPNARSLALSPSGTLFVGTRERGVVYASPGAGKARRADKPRVIARGLNMPNGVAFRDGALYVAEVSRILRFDDIEARLDRPPSPCRQPPIVRRSAWSGISQCRLSTASGDSPNAAECFQPFVGIR